MSHEKENLINFNAFPLAWIAGSFALGIFIAHFNNWSWKIYLAICFLTIFLNFLFRQISKYSQISTYFLLIAFISAGSLLYQVEIETVKPDRLKVLFDNKTLVSGEPIKVEGILLSKPELAVGGFFIELQAEKIISRNLEQSASGKIRLFAGVQSEKLGMEYDDLQLKYGTKIRVSCLLKREEKFLNPGVVSSKNILDQREIDATGIIKSPLLIERLGDETVFLPIAWLQEQRQNLILDFKSLFSQKTAGVLIASLLNNRYHLDKSTSESFRESGTFHALVISGMQITFIGILVVFILSKFTKNRWVQFFIAIPFIWAFSMMVGAEAPVTRAAIMFTVLLFSRAIFRDGNLFNALGASILLLLFWRPSDLFDPSFQLTIACLIAIIVLALPLLEKFKSIGSWHPTSENPFPPNTSKLLRSFCELIYWQETLWEKELSKTIWSCKLIKNSNASWLDNKKLQQPLRFIFETVVISICVQLWLLPFSIVYFHQISLISILFNVWIGVGMAIESLTAVGAVVISKFSTIFATPFIVFTEIINWLMIHASDIFIEKGWSSIRVPVYSGNFKVMYVLYFLPLFLLAFYIVSWKPFNFSSSKSFKFPLLATICLALMLVFHPFSSPRIDGKLHIDFLDVGQGDSALITFPNGELLLVDGGGKPIFKQIYLLDEDNEPEIFSPDTRSIGEAVVSEFLWEKGYDKVDYILATHADSDHIQGLVDIANNFEVKTAFLARTPLQDAEFVELDNVLKKQNIPITKVSKGVKLNFGEVTINILSPENDDSKNAISDNNNSIVFQMVYGNNKFLFTGDIESETEKNLVANFNWQSDVIKVAHHGSKTSSTQAFIDATKAKVAVISVGRESQFGHPHLEVLERWTAANTKVIKTGEYGTISIVSDGKTFEIDTFLPSSLK